MAVKLLVGDLAFATSSDRLREAFATIGINRLHASALDGCALEVELSRGRP